MNIENFIPEELKGRETYVFKLCSPFKHRTFHLPLDDNIYDPDTNHNVRMKVIDGCTTIFYDKLSESDKIKRPKEVTFTFNKLIVNKKDQLVLNALFMSDNFIGKKDRNISNEIKSQLYYLEDLEKEAREEYSKLADELKALNIASQASELEIEMLAGVLGLTVPKEFWRSKIMAYAKQNPKTFMRDFSSEYTKALYKVKLGFDSQIFSLDINKYGVKWANTDKTFINLTKEKFDKTKSLHESLANFFLSEDGIAAYEALNSLLDKKNMDTEIESSYTQEKRAGRPPKQV